jgi:NAD(P)-dependent dehydrogenase (short-subunit alcohol dehydrogenase family)
MRIKNQSAVVTGAGSGIGLAVACALIQGGIKAIGLVDQKPDIKELAGRIAAAYPGVSVFPELGDTTDEKFRQAVFDELEDGVGQPVTICVPAAGITRDEAAVKVENGSAELYPAALFQQVINVNLQAPYYWVLEMGSRIISKRCVSGNGLWHAEEGDTGCGVFIGSISAGGNPYQGSYGATKAAEEALAKGLAREWARYGIRTKIVHPGFVKTPMTDVMDRELVAKLLKQTYLGRLIEPAEIAEGIIHLIQSSPTLVLDMSGGFIPAFSLPNPCLATV